MNPPQIGQLACPPRDWAREAARLFPPFRIPAECRDIDPMAFTIAGDWLEARHGARDFAGLAKWRRLSQAERYHPRPNSGGWDSCGHWGLSPEQVRWAWFTAGCRNSPKFRLLLGKLPGKEWSPASRCRRSWSVARCRHYITGARWAGRRAGDFSPQALRCLGRLSCRAVAEAAMPIGRPIEGQWKHADLNWARARQCGQALASGSERARIAWATGLPVYRLPAGAEDEDYKAWKRRRARIFRVFGDVDGQARDLAQFLCPQYPNVSWSTAVLIARGVSPADVSGGVLTASQAHRWLVSGDDIGPEVWLLAEECDRIRAVGLPGCAHAASAAKTLRVAKWILHVAKSGRWEALIRPREMVIAGEVARISLLHHVDTVMDEDIVTGRDSVPDVMGRAAERQGEKVLAALAKQHRKICTVRRPLARGMRLLDTPAALVEEGRELGHCVGGYVPHVEAGRCVIVSIQDRHGRSTVELDPECREVRQHRAKGNGMAPSRHARLVSAWVKRIFAQV